MIEFFRNMSDVPFVVAANKVPATDMKTLRAVRSAIALEDEIPLLPVDARDKESVKAVLLGLLYPFLAPPAAEVAPEDTVTQLVDVFFHGAAR